VNVPLALASLLVLAGCGGTIAETTTLPPRPHAPSVSAQVIGVEPSPVRTESETPVQQASRYTAR
jgi:hypothetical protein